MREEPLLTTTPAPIKSLPEFYALAFHQARLAAQHYGALTIRTDQNLQALRPAFEMLASRENVRRDALSAACMEACNQPPNLNQLSTPSVDLVPAQEIADIAGSSLSTPYTVWALGVRHRQRAFVFWTYVAALAGNPAVSAAAEILAREALVDANLLRRERRLAWQSQHNFATENDLGDRNTSAALLESLLRRDIIVWSQMLPPAESRRLLNVGALGFSARPSAPSENIGTPVLDEIERIKKRALMRAEQLSNLYLDEADKAKDQSSLEFAQELAKHSIARLVALRAAATPSPEKSV